MVEILGMLLRFNIVCVGHWRWDLSFFVFGFTWWHFVFFVLGTGGEMWHSLRREWWRESISVHETLILRSVILIVIIMIRSNIIPIIVVVVVITTTPPTIIITIIFIITFIILTIITMTTVIVTTIMTTTITRWPFSFTPQASTRICPVAGVEEQDRRSHHSSEESSTSQQEIRPRHSPVQWGHTRCSWNKEQTTRGAEQCATGGHVPEAGRQIAPHLL